MQQMRDNSRFFEEDPVEEEEGDYSPESSGAAESAGGWRIAGPTPMRKQAPSAQSAMAGFVCLSPLVRPSPRRSQAGEPSEPGDAARVSGHHRRHRSTVRGDPVALGHNRSRKIADLGRFP